MFFASCYSCCLVKAGAKLIFYPQLKISPFYLIFWVFLNRYYLAFLSRSYSLDSFHSLFMPPKQYSWNQFFISLKYFLRFQIFSLLFSLRHLLTLLEFFDSSFQIFVDGMIWEPKIERKIATIIFYNIAEEYESA